MCRCKNILDLGDGLLYDYSRELLENYAAPSESTCTKLPTDDPRNQINNTVEVKPDMGMAKKHPGQVRLKQSLERCGQPLICFQC